MICLKVCRGERAGAYALVNAARHGRARTHTSRDQGMLRSLRVQEDEHGYFRFPIRDRITW
jgi:hypothetical protein